MSVDSAFQTSKLHLGDKDKDRMITWIPTLLKDCTNRLCPKGVARLDFGVQKTHNCHTPIFPHITGGPGGEYRDVVDIIIVNTHNIIAQRKAW
ncbi:hypothetical protein HanXRQr2_Chr14g0646931 [Helianthus annuus]|uniref:Uncharacterized protein n=1 Tax=Helianthus annuus TaxID=4232 RepID=A0A251SHQ2_HELAN|nr:hypothetical protein HanXRQr2_Chr14g0646931 [Helianthus annuus]KAJ0840605.1 hypothetical protein HanPSC8_Chr14g0620681 [Helianthus annuus]